MCVDMKLSNRYLLKFADLLILLSLSLGTSGFLSYTLFIKVSFDFRVTRAQLFLLAFSLTSLQPQTPQTPSFSLSSLATALPIDEGPTLATPPPSALTALLKF